MYKGILRVCKTFLHNNSEIHAELIINQFNVDNTLTFAVREMQFTT